jgi:hypothetical protein
MIQNDLDKFYPELLEIIKILVENGGDLHKKNDKGKKPLDVINVYRYNKKEDFDSVVSMFRPAIPNVDELVSFDDNIWK